MIIITFLLDQSTLLRVMKASKAELIKISAADQISHPNTELTTSKHCTTNATSLQLQKIHN